MKRILFLTIRIIILSLTGTISGNAQWYQHDTNISDDLYSIQFINPNYGWAANPVVKKFYRTTNGGLTWTVQISDAIVFGYDFINEYTGWYSGRPDGRILKTTNGGDNWDVIYQAGCIEFFQLKFLNDSIGFAKASVCLEGNKILKTTDGGISWNYLNQPEPFFHEMEVLDEDKIILTGKGKIYRTSNGGNDWEMIPNNLPEIILRTKFFSPQIGWCLANTGELFNTTNGGISWTVQADTVNSFFFLNPQIGWYSSGAKIVYSTDGGINWEQQQTDNTNNITGITFIDQNIGWACGMNGTILYTMNGGTPVELTSFTIDAVGYNVHLNWVTASEENNRGFEIEKKSWKIDEPWNTITFIEGNGTTTETNIYSFVDENLEPDKYSYRIKQIDFNGSFEYSREVEVEINLPKEFALYQNYPNPFNPATKIKYSIPSVIPSPVYRARNLFVTLTVYDILGNEIAILVNEAKPAGEYEVEFDAGKYNLSSGVFFYKLNYGALFKTMKAVLVK